MTRVTIDGETYACPFAGLFRPHTPGERQRMLASIQRHGIKAHVFTYLSPLHGRAVLDGLNRANYGAELGCEVPEFCFGAMPDAVARELAVSLNLDRRQLTPEEQTAARRDRVKRIAERVGAGESYRAAGDAEGVSLPQVQRDLELALVSPDTTKTRRKLSPTSRAYRAAKTLAARVKAVLGSGNRQRLASVASSHGVPLAGKSWPALESVCLVLRDVANGGRSA